MCSPRKFGNSELFVKELYRQLPGAWDLSLIRLPELDIRPCKACYQCLFGEMRCHQDDDFAIVLEALAAADAYVVAAPTYLLGPNASLKGFLDRGLAFYAHLDEALGQTRGRCGHCRDRGAWKDTASLPWRALSGLRFGDLRASAVLYGALPGEIFLEDGGKTDRRAPGQGSGGG